MQEQTARFSFIWSEFGCQFVTQYVARSKNAAEKLPGLERVSHRKSPSFLRNQVWSHHLRNETQPILLAGDI